MCRLFAITSEDPLSPMVALEALENKIAVKLGHTNGFDLSPRPRDAEVGFRFSGIYQALGSLSPIIVRYPHTTDRASDVTAAGATRKSLARTAAVARTAGLNNNSRIMVSS